MVTKHLYLLCRLLHPALVCAVQSALVGGDAVFDQHCAAVLLSQGENIIIFDFIFVYLNVMSYLGFDRIWESNIKGILFK